MENLSTEGGVLEERCRSAKSIKCVRNSALRTPEDESARGEGVQSNGEECRDGEEVDIIDALEKGGDKSCGSISLLIAIVHWEGRDFRNVGEDIETFPDLLLNLSNNYNHKRKLCNT